MEGTSRRHVGWAYLGRIPYREAVALQEASREGVRSGALERLLLLEHPPVFTLGRNADRAELIADPTWLERNGVGVEECDRGGRITYHGPGQLVGYPILDLNPDRRDLRRYVRDLLLVLVRTLRHFGVEAAGSGEPSRIGVWVGERKIASVGVHVSRWVTTHGFALNVSTDLSRFAGIVPCGLGGIEMCSIESLTGRRHALEEVAGVCAREFGGVFERVLERSRIEYPVPR